MLASAVRWWRGWGLLGLVMFGIVSPVAADGEAAPAGFRAFADPETGELLEGPPPGTPPAALSGPARKMPVPLVQEKSAAAGFVIRLGDSFHQDVRAVVGPDGQTHADCVPGSHADEHGAHR